MRRYVLADALGIIAVLVALAWLPGAADPLTNIKLLFLVGGGLAIAPAVVYRWVKQPRPSWPILIPCAAAVGIVLWGLVSMVGSGAPLWNSLMGWWGRGNGWLAWVGAAFLLLGAATLSPTEVSRTVSWMLGGASVVAVVGFLQLAGVEIPAGSGGGAVTGTMGNTNFASGYFAITGVLALGTALSRGPTWRWMWGSALFICAAFLSYQTKSIQGPVSLLAGAIALGVAWALLYRGRWRVPGLVTAGAVVLMGAVAVVGSVYRIGPLADLWADRTFGIRQQYWQSALNIMQGVPVFGTGPDGFARYVSEYRPESYVELLGPVLRVSAAHNIALQFGATLGYLGLLLWALTFVGAAVVLLIRIFKRPVVSIALTASVMGALATYIIQGMVSIDMLPLLATGWLVAGLALAMAREQVPEAPSTPHVQGQSRKARAAAASAKPPARQAVNAVPAWVLVTGGLLGLMAVAVVGSQIAVTNQIQAISSQETAIGFIENPMVPCVLRVQVTQQVIQQLPAEVSVPATLRATDLDHRCAPMITFASDMVLQQQQFDEADALTSEGVQIDPLFDLAWALRARYFLGVGDLPAAEAAAVEARRVVNLYPVGADTTQVDSLFNDIQGAKDQAG